MSNLLPPEGMKMVRREYRLRTLSVWGFLLAAVIAASAGFLLPTFILVAAQFQVIEPILAEGEEVDVEAYREEIAKVTRANRIATQLQRAEEGMTAAVALAEVQRALVPGITLTGITFTKEDETEIALEARGIAATREALIAFVESVRRNPNFEDATMPIDGLAQGADASFAVTIVVRTE